MARRAQHLRCSLCERSERADNKLDNSRLGSLDSWLGLLDSRLGSMLPDVAWPAARSAALWAFCLTHLGRSVRQAQWITGSAHGITSLARWIVRAGGVVVSFRPPTQEVGGSIPVSASSAAYSAGLQKLGTEHGDFFIRNTVVYINTAAHHCRMEMRKSQTLLLNIPIHVTQCKTVREHVKCNKTADVNLQLNRRVDF